MKSINAKVLQEMLISGANNLYNHYPEIDALNVFPVSVVISVAENEYTGVKELATAGSVITPTIGCG